MKQTTITVAAVTPKLLPLWRHVFCTHVVLVATVMMMPSSPSLTSALPDTVKQLRVVQKTVSFPEPGNGKEYTLTSIAGKGKFHSSKLYITGGNTFPTVWRSVSLKIGIDGQTLFNFKDYDLYAFGYLNELAYMCLIEFPYLVEFETNFRLSVYIQNDNAEGAPARDTQLRSLTYLSEIVPST